MSKPKKSSTPASRREQLRQQQEAAAKQRRTMRIIAVAATVLALVIIGVVVTLALQKNNDTKANLAEQITPPNAVDTSAIGINKSVSADAPVVQIFLDYQCPICKTTESTYGPALRALSDKGEINLQYRTMIFMDVNLKNTASTRAAEAAACSDVHGVYADYHDAIFANQPSQEVAGSEGYSDELLRSTIPGAVGLAGPELADFQACYDGRATKDFVETVAETASKDGVNSTPTFWVNGKTFDIGSVAPVEADLLKAIKAAA